MGRGLSGRQSALGVQITDRRGIRMYDPEPVRFQHPPANRGVRFPVELDDDPFRPRKHMAASGEYLKLVAFNINLEQIYLFHTMSGTECIN